MTENEPLDVLIAVYLIPDLAHRDFEALVKLVEEKTISSDGVVLVTKDAEGKVRVEETGDHAGRKGAKVGGGAGLVVGLFSPPLLVATAAGAGIGAVAGKFATHRVASGIGDKMDEALPAGSAGIIAVYDHSDADVVAGAVPNTIRTSVAQIERASAKELKKGLQEASATLTGSNTA